MKVGYILVHCKLMVELSSFLKNDYVVNHLYKSILWQCAWVLHPGVLIGCGVGSSFLPSSHNWTSPKVT